MRSLLWSANYQYPPGLVRGFRGDLAVTASGANVSAWGDFTGNGNNSAAGDLTRMPTVQQIAQCNGRPCIHTQFVSGTFKYYLLGTMAAPYTGATLERVTVGFRDQYFATGIAAVTSDWNSANPDAGNYVDAFEVQETPHVGSNVIDLIRAGGHLQETPPSNTAPFVLRSRFNGTVREMIINGVSTGTTASAGAFHITNFSVGSGYNSSTPGQLVEVSLYTWEDLLFDHVLTPSQWASLNGHFSAFYGQNHP